MENVIEVASLRRAYADNEVVKGVSFHVERGEILGLLGRNGAGKTTTVEMVQGLRKRDSGTVSVLGLDPAASPGSVRRRIGSQLQSSALPARMRVGEAIDLFASFADDPVPTAQLLNDWDLDRLARRSFAKLSGGERQRLFLALALVNDPEIVFLDELTTGLDPAARRQTWRHVEKIRDVGTTVILVTHFMEEAETLCDRLAILSEGRIASCGTPHELKRAHAAGSEVRFSADGRSYAFLASLPSVDRLSVVRNAVVLSGTNEAPFEIAAALSRAGLHPQNFHTRQPTLEDVFLTLTEVTT